MFHREVVLEEMMLLWLANQIQRSGHSRNCSMMAAGEKLHIPR